ncbi:hypothetical protein [Saccharothrix hoggarensis]|uniref:HAF family extracellular repeat protein n=1 Tax=Saccharothrix hoggarensis TaxID=913853 RepID=A0ABW3QR07_9PSEU
MPKLRMTAGVLALAVALPLVSAPGARAAAFITELPGLPGHPSHRAVAVNDLGHVVGTASGNGPSRAVRWAPGLPAEDLGGGTPRSLNQAGRVLIQEYLGGSGTYVQRPRIWDQGKVTDLTPSGSGYVVANGINRDGVVPMTYSTSPSGYHQERAAVWRDGRHTSLPVSGAHLSLSAINDAGVIVGSKAPMFGTDAHAFRCAGTTCSRLADAPGTGPYSVTAVNEAGVVVGNRQGQALMWADGQVVVLAPAGGVANSPQALNERGDVVGWTTDANGVRRATLWPLGGKPVDLGVPGPSEAVAVNDRGDVIGWTSSAGSPRAFLWRAGVVEYLSSLGGTHTRPVALNERGTIVGESTTADGTVKAVKWTLLGPHQVG